MDPDGRVIPVVEGDQGEGFRDLLDFDELPENLKKLYQDSLKTDRKQQSIVSKRLNK